MLSFLRLLFSTRVLSLVVPESVLIFSCYVLAAYWTGGTDPSVFLFYDNGLLQIALVEAGLLAGMQFNKLYVQVGVRSRILLFQQLCLAMGVTFLFESMLSYTQDATLILAPLTMMMGSALTLAVLMLWRSFYSAVVWKSYGTKRVLFYGTNPAVREASRSLTAHPELGIEIVGYIDDARESGSLLDGAPVLGATADLDRVAAKVRPDRIVVGVDEPRGGMPFLKLLDLQFAGVEIQRIEELYENACERVSIDELRPSQLIFSDELGARRGNVALQAIYSNILGLAGLALLSPVMLLLAVAVKLSSAGPVFDTHAGLGLNLAPFTMYRFRCSSADGTETGVGRWMQRHHLDSLPQLLSVIRGEMALVGPRPHRPEFIPVLLEQMPYYGQRHAVRPGMMGWSQLNCDYGRNVKDARTALEYDLYYIKHMSPALDAYIVLHSLMEVPFRSS